MPGPVHGVLLLRSGENMVEIVNHARSAAYLQNVGIDGIDICSILGWGGCEAYSRMPYAVEPGNVFFPEGILNNFLSVGSVDPLPDHSPVDEWEVVVRYEFESLGVTTNLYVGAALHPFSLTVDNGIRIAFTGVSGLIGNVDSIPVPGLTVGTPVWLRGHLDRTTAECSYWYSYDDRVTPEGVVWIPLGTPTVGANAGTAPFSPTWTLDGIGGGGVGKTLYYAEGYVNDLPLTRIQSGDFPVDDGTAVQYFPTSGGAMGALTRDITPPSDAAVSTAEVLDIGGYDCDYWPLLQFSDPATDPAPWYNPSYPASADALGIWITEWTGLGNGHVTRTSTPRGGYGGGSIVGPAGASGRVQKLNVVLLARSEEAMQYLFDWLSDTLISSCSQCADDTLMFFRHCPDVEDVKAGIGEQRRVGLIEAPTWEADIGGRGRCLIRQASFTLEAGDPCVYLPSSDVTIDEDSYEADLPTCFDDAKINVDRRPCRPSCSELPEDCRTSLTIDVDASRSAAPVVYFSNDFDTPSYPMRAIVYADPLDIGTVPNPCGLPILGEIYIRPLPPWSHFIWDVAGRDTQFRDVTTGPYVDGWPYVDANDPPTPRFFKVDCGRIHVVLEPATLCVEIDGADIVWPGGGMEFSDPHYPTTTVRLQERTGCP